MRRAWLAVLLAGGALAGCAGTKAANTGTLPGGIGQAQTASSAERQVAQKADGSQAGRVVSVSKDELVLQPYESSAATAYLKLQETAPVFQQGQQTSMYPAQTLKPGQDVNVYFTRKGSDRPNVLGVRVLSPEEASQVQQQLSQAGKGAAPSNPGASASATPGASGDAAAKQFSNADGAQAGEVAEVSQGVIVLDPYQQGAGQAVMAYDDSAKVLRNGQTVGINTLSPGDDVRVFFKNQSGGKPKVIGVEVLTPDQKAAAGKK